MSGSVFRDLSGYSSDSELKYQKVVEGTFFNPSDKRFKYGASEERERTRHWYQAHARGIERIGQAFLTARTARGTAISCGDTCARDIVLAESRIFQLFAPRGYYCHTPYVSDPKREGYTAEESVTFGAPLQEFRYCQQVQPHQNHKGNYHTSELADYGRIGSRLLDLTRRNPETQKRLAGLMLTFPKKMSGIAPDSLQTALGVAPSEADVKFINSLCYNIFIKEVARRQLPKDATHHEPWAIALIRALKLAAEGLIPLGSIFQQNAPYGSFTEVEIGKKMTQGKSSVEASIRRINREYRCKVASIIDARQELRDIYGGASDSDDEVYPQPFQALPARLPEAGRTSPPDRSVESGAAYPLPPGALS